MCIKCLYTDTGFTGPVHLAHDEKWVWHPRISKNIYSGLDSC